MLRLRRAAVVWSRKNRELPFLQKKDVNSFESEEEFQDATDIATLRKSKPELYHFEQVVPYGSRILPNDKFKFLVNPVKWESHEEYYRAALDAREEELESYHPSDWDFDYDHRITWFGMEKLEDEDCADKQSWQIFPKNIDEKVNIGFYLPEPNPAALEDPSKEQRIAMKKDILLGQLKIDEAKINAAFFDNFTEMTNENIIGAIDTAQEHYRILQDQFGNGRFCSVVPFEVSWGKMVSFWGNEIPVENMREAPEFKLKHGDGSFYTVVISSLDSNFMDHDGSTPEILHYAVSNITADNSGDTLCSYLPPIPAKGSGFHRLVCTVYHHSEELDASKLSIDGSSLSNRQFSSAHFLKENEEILTPAAFRFSQVQWDESVSETFSKLLEMPEPKFAYEAREEFPLSRPAGLPSGIEMPVIKSWYPKEPKYPRRMERQPIKPKLRQINYLYDLNNHHGMFDNK